MLDILSAGMPALALPDVELDAVRGGFSFTVHFSGYGVQVNGGGVTTVSPGSFIRAVVAGAIKGAHA